MTRVGGGYGRWLWRLPATVMLALAALGLGLPAATARSFLPGAVAAGPVFEWIVLDAETGQVLGEQNADDLTYPASLTKMMTLYLTFEQLNLGHITLDRQFTVSAYAASRAPSRLGLEPGESVAVRDLILGVVTKSANDAATVLAEGLAGSEENFARYMNWKARQLGMDHSWYQNASGLPNPGQRTTARDIARLALALYQHFPREYRYFATREFEFRGQIVHGHDHLLEWYPGADGIKTGFINASGFNLATSAVRNGRRLIGVVMGGRSAHSRDVQMASLLDQGFAMLASGRSSAPQSEPLIAAAPAQPAFPAPPQPPAEFPAPAMARATAPPTAAPAAAALAAAAQSAATHVAAAQAVSVHPPTATPAVAGPAATGQKMVAESEQEQGDADDAKPSFLGKVTRAALRHLAPVGLAEASTVMRAERTVGDWAIQIGAFRAAGAAEHAAHEAARLALVSGKPPQILPPPRTERPGLYRARLLHFTQKAAQTACTELHRHGLACSVVHAGGGRVG